MKHRLSEAEQRIALLERKIAREKIARETAERQLEEFSWKIFKANSTLKQSLDEAHKKTRELAFLHDTSLRIASQSDVDALIETTLEVVSDFFDCRFALSINLDDDLCLATPNHKLFAKDQGWTSVPEVMLALVPILINARGIHEKWIVTPVNHPELEDITYCLHINFPTSDTTQLAVALASDKEMVDEGDLYVLDTVRGQLLTGIRRRINDERLKQYTEDLETALNNLKETQRQLIQSEKMASLGQLAAGVAHEINNPLSYVRSNLQILQEYLSDLASFETKLRNLDSLPVSKQLQTIKQAVKECDFSFICNDANSIIETNLQGINRVTEIVRGLKNFSHAGEESFEPLDLIEVIHTSLKIVWNHLKYQHTVSNNLPDKLPKVFGNVGQLQQVFVNLFVNAAQAMPQGGTLTIDSRDEDTFIVIDVCDTGIGMDEPTLAKLFTPFFTTKPVGEGTGLGLSVSFAVLEAHSATIKVSSTLGKGSCFQLRFPKLSNA